MVKIVRSNDFRFNKIELIEALKAPTTTKELKRLEDQDFFVANENNWRRSYFVVNATTWIEILKLAGLKKASEDRKNLIESLKDKISSRFSNLVKIRFAHGKA